MRKNLRKELNQSTDTKERQHLKEIFGNMIPIILFSEKELASYCDRKTYYWNNAILIPEYLQTIFHTIILFFQPNVAK